MCSSITLALDLDHVLALAQRRSPEAQVLGALALRSPRRSRKRVEPRADALGQRAARRSAAPARMPATSAAIHSTPEPAKPSHVIDSGPSA